MSMRDRIASDLAACKKVFDEVDIPWVITDGIVLGYVRHGDIMEWDTDIDMGIFVEVTDEERLNLSNVFHKYGFKIGKRLKNDFAFGKRQSPLNLWFFHWKGEYYEAFPRSTPGFKFVVKAEWYKEPQIVRFCNDMYPMPNHLEDYLDAYYGKDWRTNIVKSHDKWFKEKRGGKLGPVWLTCRSSKEGDLWPKILKEEENP